MKYFGVSLKEGANHPSNGSLTIPFPVKHMLEYLSEKENIREDLYKDVEEESKIKKKMDQLIEEYDKGEEAPDLDEYGAIVVSETLVDYFRQLPEPILSHKLNDRLRVSEEIWVRDIPHSQFGEFAADFHTLDLEGPMYVSSKNFVASIRNIIRNLPDENFVVFRILVNYISKFWKNFPNPEMRKRLLDKFDTIFRTRTEQPKRGQQIYIPGRNYGVGLANQDRYVSNEPLYSMLQFVAFRSFFTLLLYEDNISLFFCVRKLKAVEVISQKDERERFRFLMDCLNCGEEEEDLIDCRVFLSRVHVFRVSTKVVGLFESMCIPKVL